MGYRRQIARGLAHLNYVMLSGPSVGQAIELEKLLAST